MEKRYSLRGYLAGTVTARAGDEMAGPALMLAGLAVTGSAVEASSLLAAVTVSAALGGPVLGTLLDRSGRPGRLLAGVLVLHAAGLGLVGAVLGRVPFAVTVSVAVLTGLLGPAVSGGWTAQLPRVLPGDRLPRGNALDAMTYGVASLTGPALAGGVAQTLGAPAAVVVSVVLIALAAPVAWLLPVPPHAGRRTSRTGTVPVVRDLVAGLRVVTGRPALARATLTSVVSCVAQGMLTACLPLLGARVLGGAGSGAALLSCAAVSALAANAVLARCPRAAAPDAIVRAGALVQAAGVACALWWHPVVLVVAALLVGIGEGPQLTALFAVRHREAPARLRAQIFTTGASLKITGFALGAAAAGPLVTWSLPGTLVLAAGVAALAAPAALAVRGI